MMWARRWIFAALGGRGVPEVVSSGPGAAQGSPLGLLLVITQA
jgi:hypothetical protein